MSQTTTYPRHEYAISHFGLLLRFTHPSADAHYLLAKGEKFDETTRQWVSIPCGRGSFSGRLWDYTSEDAERRIMEHIAEVTATPAGAVA